nr:hypothetical protein [Selenomonas sp.]
MTSQIYGLVRLSVKERLGFINQRAGDAEAGAAEHGAVGVVEAAAEGAREDDGRSAGFLHQLQGQLRVSVVFGDGIFLDGYAILFGPAPGLGAGAVTVAEQYIRADACLLAGVDAVVGGPAGVIALKRI